MRVAINGLGRIGRAALKLILDTPELDLVAVNDLIQAQDLAYLIKYDTVYGRYGKSVKVEANDLVIGGRPIRMLSEKDPAQLPWRDLKIDLVFECTGFFTKREDLEKHLKAGAKRVILSAVAKSEEISTVVFGTNQASTTAAMVSCASCTTNCITPVVEVMKRRLGVRKAIMTTVHAYTSSQKIVDGPSKDIRRGRAGGQNLVPTSTGAAVATTKVIPELRGKFDGIAVRAPIPAGSLADIVFLTEKKTSRDEVNAIFTEESRSERYRNVLGVSEDPIVSSDVIGDSRASIVDLGATQVVDGDFVKVLSWYDNEWGYTSQMVREAASMAHAPVLAH